MKLSIRTTLAIALACCFSLSTPAFAQQASAPAPTSADDMDIADAVDATAPEASAPDAAAPDAMAPAAAPADMAGTKPKRDPSAANPAPADPSLLPVFKDFGEVAGLTALMDDFMVQLLADARMRPFFENADQKVIKAHLVEQFCVILGGPCTYTGRDMKSSHKGLDIGRSQFNALVENLQVAMDKRGISFRAQNKLLAKLAPMHREIETR